MTWLRLSFISRTLGRRFAELALAIPLVTCALASASATTAPRTGLTGADHVRFACVLADPTGDPQLDQRAFCEVALSALQDLTTGHLDDKVAAQPAWAATLDPDAARRRCFNQIQGPVPAGSCDWYLFRLTEPERPLTVVPISEDSIYINEPTGLTIVIRAARATATSMNASALSLEPANAYAQEPKIFETSKTIAYAPGPEGKRGLHQELQLMLVTYFWPQTVNELKAHDIQRGDRGERYELQNTVDMLTLGNAGLVDGLQIQSEFGWQYVKINFYAMAPEDQKRLSSRTRSKGRRESWIEMRPSTEPDYDKAELKEARHYIVHHPMPGGREDRDAIDCKGLSFIRECATPLMYAYDGIYVYYRVSQRDLPIPVALSSDPLTEPGAVLQFDTRLRALIACFRDHPNDTRCRTSP